LRKVVAPVLQLSGAYWQDENASMNSNINSPLEYPNDNYILAFAPNEHLFWATFLGGALSNSELDNYNTSSDFLTDLATNGSDYLYVTGMTECKHSPYTECPPGAYCDQTYKPGDDCFIGKFKTASFPTKIKTVQKESVNLNVYPNPSDNVFYVSFLNKDFNSFGNEAKIIMTNELGSKISEVVLKLKAGINRFILNFNSLPSGVYFLNIGNQKFEGTAKLIKN
jgi:hypothetical protein